MKRFNGRGMKAFFILSIVVPVGLLTTFRLTGILQGPIFISETVTLEPVTWQFQRPNQSTRIDERLNASIDNGVLSSSLQVIIGIYDEDSFVHGGDYIAMALKMNSTLLSPSGFIRNVTISFPKDIHPSILAWLPTYLNFINLSIVSTRSGWTTEKAYQIACIESTAANRPLAIQLSVTAEWILLTSSDQSHQVELFSEITYYDGTAYERMVQPFQFKIVGRQNGQ